MFSRKFSEFEGSDIKIYTFKYQKLYSSKICITWYFRADGRVPDSGGRGGAATAKGCWIPPLNITLLKISAVRTSTKTNSQNLFIQIIRIQDMKQEENTKTALGLTAPKFQTSKAPHVQWLLKLILSIAFLKLLGDLGVKSYYWRNWRNFHCCSAMFSVYFVFHRKHCVIIFVIWHWQTRIFRQECFITNGDKWTHLIVEWKYSQIIPTAEK